MNLFGLEITRAKTKTLSGVDSRGGMSSWFRILESFTGAWQTNVEVELTNVLTYSPVYACIRLISSDIGKMRLRLMQLDERSGIWTETFNPAYSPVLRKPNRYQTRNQFAESWSISKMIHGNAYILKERDGRTNVRAMHVLDPTRVTPLVSEDGSVFYQLQGDNLSGLRESVIAPASEIIHDRHTPLYHPLSGVGPISSCGVAAVEALRIQESSAQFFGNNSQPGGILMAPGHITKETAERIAAAWTTNYSGANAGKVAVLGDNLKFESVSVKATDAQLIEQLRWTAEDVARAFGVPFYKLGGPVPAYNNVESLNLQYYQDVIQAHVEHMEALLDDGLGLAEAKIGGIWLGTDFDESALMRMDTTGRVNAATLAITAGMSPNEVRARFFDLGPVTGGDSPMLQQQNFSLEALAERDKDKPFSKPTAAAPAAIAAPVDPREDEDAEKAWDPAVLLTKVLQRVAA